MTSRRVLLHGGAPWGFRLRGGADVQQHIKITRVNLNSKAAKEGVREGDIVTSINGHSTKNCTNAEAHVLLKNAGDTLFLGLNEDVMATSKPKNSLDKINLQSEAANFEQSSLSSNASSEASQGLLHGDSKRKNLPTTQTEETKPNKTKRNTTKEELLKYFINFYPHSKYLDVIAEESSDISDIETLTKPIEDVCTSYVTAISNDPEISFVSDCSSSSNCSSKRNSSYDESETEDESEVCKEKFSVPSLKEFCIRFLLKHPFGREILEELATVARNLQMRSENVDCSKYIDNLMDFLKSLSLYEEDIQEINSNDEHEILEKLQTIQKQLNNIDEDYIEQEIERLEEENEKLDAEINCVEISMNAFDDDNRIDAIDETVTKGAERLINAVSCILNTTQESIVAKSSCEMGNGVWSPGQNNSAPKDPPLKHTKSLKFADEPIPVVWTPRSAGSSPVCERKEFRPVNFESPVLQRKCRTDSESSSSGVQPPWKAADQSNVNDFKPKIPSSQSSPSVFQDTALKLPRPQNPTVVLLQKAREGQIPKKTSYIINDEKINDTSAIMTSKVNEPKQEKYADVKDNVTIDRNVRKYDGIGPTSKDGMPLVLKSEVKESNQSKWYKQMYDTIHKQKPHRDEYVTVKYKQTKAPHSTGYLSEPELDSHRGYYTQDYNKYATLDRRRTLSTQNQNDFAPSTMPRISNTTRYVYTPPGSVKPPAQEYYSPPGRIEDYIPGHSSISDRETKEWWDAVMDIFNGHLEKQRNIQPQNKGFMSQGLKESGYESDSTLIFKRREDPSMQLSPKEHKEVYKAIQKGGDVPFQGLRKPAPEKPKEPEAPPPPPKGHHGVKNYFDQDSSRKYVENEVTIHYKTPIRQEVKEALSEEELAEKQAEAMKKIYEEEKRRKYFQELHDMNSRRHTDNFVASQKSPIPLNRYDDFVDDLSPVVKQRPRSPEPRLVAKALYNFVGQSPKELSFRKGDIIYIKRQVDKNWFEGEHNAMVGLFPVNYVEVAPYDGVKITPRKSTEGQARAKYNFIAQTHLELSLAKGELVVITRRVDENWFEGRIGGRKGIFPVSYVEVLIDPSENAPNVTNTKPVASPAAHSLLLNGSSGGKESMGSHSYVPSFSRYQEKNYAPQASATYGSLKNPSVQELHVDTHTEAVPYRALYKYCPQNDDELELFEGDTVYVLEKCDDGWYVGSSNRTGAFGTFPGNYVQPV